MNFSIEEFAVIALILDEEETVLRKKRKRTWIHEICKERKIEGEFAILYKGLIDDGIKFYQYFRMSQWSFYTLLEKKLNLELKNKRHFKEKQ